MISKGRMSALGAALALSAVVVAAGHDQESSALFDGLRRLQTGDPAGAAAILESVTKREPGNAAAWRALGAAAQRVKDWPRAIEAYLKALAIEPSVVSPMFNVAVAHAAMGHQDDAFAWLTKAKATGKVDMSQLEISPPLEPLRGDARFASLLPHAEDFRNPLVGSENILREWDGEKTNDQFGWIARNIGDVDGDGVPDVVTSAPTHATGGEGAGRIYVYSTKTGRLLWTRDGSAGDELGTGVESAGDTNADGIPDVVASAPGSGRAYVYSGRDGKVLLTLAAEGGKDDKFGNHISGAGDVDRDGYADVIVGAPDNSAGGAKAGRAYVFSGKDGNRLLTLTGERAGGNFGSTVAGYADATQTFLLVGAPKAGPHQTGRVYVYDRLSPNPRFTIDSDETGSALGAMFLGVVGDVNGDRIPDVYASDWSNNAKGWSTGRVYIHSGKDGRRLHTLTGETAGEGFGIGPGRAGDVNGDGLADIIVGAWQYGRHATSAGRVYLYSGKTGELLKTYDCRTPGDTFGFDAVGLGDIDGDGTLDFLITSAWSGIRGFHSGRVFVISSGIRVR